jgi:hypothetical protein
MLNLEDININEEKQVIFSSEHLKIYNTITDDFRKKGYWSFDDGPYVANVDFLLDKIYDETYFSFYIFIHTYNKLKNIYLTKKEN